MGLLFRRGKNVGPVRLTATQSGVSAAARFRRISVSSKGRVTIRFTRGFSYTFRIF